MYTISETYTIVVEVGLLKVVPFFTTATWARFSPDRLRHGSKLTPSVVQLTLTALAVAIQFLVRIAYMLK